MCCTFTGNVDGDFMPPVCPSSVSGSTVGSRLMLSFKWVVSSFIWLCYLLLPAAHPAPHPHTGASGTGNWESKALSRAGLCFLEVSFPLSSWGKHPLSCSVIEVWIFYFFLFQCFSLPKHFHFHPHFFQFHSQLCNFFRNERAAWTLSFSHSHHVVGLFASVRAWNKS